MPDTTGHATTTDPTGPTDLAAAAPGRQREDPMALFARARAWLYQGGEPGWIADAFAHWVITEIAPHEPVPDPLNRLWRRWNYDPLPRVYRARHGARLASSPPWQPGQPLPEPPAIEHRPGPPPGRSLSSDPAGAAPAVPVRPV